MTMPFTFSMQLEGRGWIEGSLDDEYQEIELTASFISNPPWDMVDRTLAMLRGVDQVEWSWREEPGEYRWLLRREGDHLHVVILEFDEEFSRLTSDRGTTIFVAETSILRWGTQLRGQLLQLLHAHGEIGYKEVWGHEFPSHFDEFTEQLKQSKESTRRIK